MIEKLLKESNQSGAIAGARPTLVGLTRKINDLIFSDIAAIQPTSSPIATVYGVRYEAISDDRQTKYEVQAGHRTFTGATSIDTDLGAPDGAMEPYDVFSQDGYNYEVVVAGAYDGKTTEALLIDVFDGNIRLYTDASSDDSPNHSVQDSRFLMDHWRSQVKSRRVKSPITMELLRDMQGMNLDGEATVEDLLATTISEEVNSDIVMKTITVATRVANLDVSAVSTYDKGRDIIASACEMAANIYRETTFPGTFILCSPKVAGFIRSSGQVGDDDVVKGTGLILVTDGKASLEYMLVGTKLEFDGLDTISPVFYSPYTETDGAGSYLLATDVKNLQPVPGLINRYAITASPVYNSNAESGPQDGEDWVGLSGTSPLARLARVNLS